MCKPFEWCGLCCVRAACARCSWRARGPGSCRTAATTWSSSSRPGTRPDTSASSTRRRRHATIACAVFVLLPAFLTQQAVLGSASRPCLALPACWRSRGGCTHGNVMSCALLAPPNPSFLGVIRRLLLLGGCVHWASGASTKQSMLCNQGLGTIVWCSVSTIQ